MKENIKQFLPLFLFFIALVFASFINYSDKSVPASAKPSINRPTVIIDAGHGGFDGGAVATDGTAEKDINLSIAKKLNNILSFNGINTVMTRTTDAATNSRDGKIRSKKKSDMQNRLALMEKYPDAIFVSIHLNKYTTSAASGAQTFYSDNFKQSRKIAENIQKSIITLLEPYNNRTVKPSTSSAFLLYNAKIPAVLVECGFLSNNKDLEELKNDEFQCKMAFAIANGLLNFY